MFCEKWFSVPYLLILGIFIFRNCLEVEKSRFEFWGVRGETVIHKGNKCELKKFVSLS